MVAVVGNAGVDSEDAVQVASGVLITTLTIVDKPPFEPVDVVVPVDDDN